MDPVKVKDDISWVGVLHPDLRLFDDICPTRTGTSYNSYLIGAKRPTLVDTVKPLFTEEFIRDLKRSISPREIAYIVTSHAEPDHSGALAALLEEAVNATILGSQTALSFLKSIVHKPFKAMAVTDSTVIDIGDKTLRFFYVPFLHWPDTMFTYIEQERILFTCDAFGAHFCPYKIFNDLHPDYTPDCVDFREYFDCIMRPFKDKILQAIEKIRPLDIEIIATGHGPILRQNPWAYVKAFEEWSKAVTQKTGKRVLIAYVSSHGNTARLAREISEAIAQEGLDVSLVHITEVDLCKLREDLEQADALLVGTPTINRDVPRSMWEFLTHLSTVSLRLKLAGAFGSYGWGGEALGIIEARLKGQRIKLFEDVLKVNFVPTDEDLNRARDFGIRFAERFKGLK